VASTIETVGAIVGGTLLLALVVLASISWLRSRGRPDDGDDSSYPSGPGPTAGNWGEDPGGGGI
jgi:hypothetical protein